MAAWIGNAYVGDDLAGLSDRFDKSDEGGIESPNDRELVDADNADVLLDDEAFRSEGETIDSRGLGSWSATVFPIDGR